MSAYFPAAAISAVTKTSPSDRIVLFEPIEHRLVQRPGDDLQHLDHVAHVLHGAEILALVAQEGFLLLRRHDLRVLLHVALDGDDQVRPLEAGLFQLVIRGLLLLLGELDALVLQQLDQRHVHQLELDLRVHLPLGSVQQQHEVQHAGRVDAVENFQLLLAAEQFVDVGGFGVFPERLVPDCFVDAAHLDELVARAPPSTPQ